MDAAAEVARIKAEDCACGRPSNHRGMCTARWSRVRGDAPLRTKRPTGETRSSMAKRRFKQYAPGGGYTLAADHPAAIEGRTLFPNRRTASALIDRLLKSGEHNAKIGAMVVKGPLAGAKTFTLTLEERATCPRSCAMWGACYGNGMQWPQRIQADAGAVGVWAYERLWPKRVAA